MTINIGDYIQKPTYGLGNISKYGREYAVYELKLMAGYYEIIEVEDNHIQAKLTGTGRKCINNKHNLVYYGDLKTSNQDLKIELIKN